MLRDSAPPAIVLASPSEKPIHHRKVQRVDKHRHFSCRDKSARYKKKRVMMRIFFLIGIIAFVSPLHAQTTSPSSFTIARAARFRSRSLCK